MKDIMIDSAPPGEPVERENFGNRKLIRPTLPRVENHSNHGTHSSAPMQSQERRERPDRHDRGERMDHRNDRGMGGGGKKTAPPEQTNAENFYYLKQMQSKTSMTIVMKDGEVLKGVIEWYDKTCLKVNREGEPNLLVFKSNIKYMYKA